MTPAAAAWRPPLGWRASLMLARVAVWLVCRLRVTGSPPPMSSRGPLLLAANHIGVFDPVVLAAACHAAGLAPRFLATGGLFRTPVVGSALRAFGQIRVDRQSPAAAHALDEAARALAQRSVVAGYPEGRITLDPGLWPERGKTGMARLALRTGAPLAPVAQWGAHEVMAYHGWRAMAATVASSVWRRPVVRVHFGPPVDLSDLDPSAPGAAQHATERLISALTRELAPLRTDESRLPRYIDPTRPLSLARRFRAAGLPAVVGGGPGRNREPETLTPGG
jgi:1-acyl-sn-glycerol-3-phosphate acyltransferase